MVRKGMCQGTRRDGQPCQRDEQRAALDWYAARRAILRRHAGAVARACRPGRLPAVSPWRTMRRLPCPPLALLGVPLVFALDGLKLACLWRGYPRALEGVLDHAAHAATAAVLLAPWRPEPPGAWALGALAGASLIDVDHIPGELGRTWIAPAGERPYTHTALALGALALLGARAGGRWRLPVSGAVAGLATHFLRDLATGGCRLGWPLVWRNVTIPYWAYAATLLTAALVRPRRKRSA